MSNNQIDYEVELPCSATTAFDAWLDSEKHGAMVESVADINPTIGGKFSIWEDAVNGKTNLVDRENLIIEQDWRYNYDDWPMNEPSKIVVRFEPIDDENCRLIFKHTAVPKKYIDEVSNGWQEYYWKPMKRYFESKTD